MWYSCRAPYILCLFYRSIRWKTIWHGCCFILNIWGKPRQIKIHGFILFCWVVSLWKWNVYDTRFSYVTTKQLHSDGNNFLSAQGVSVLAADLKQTVFITHPSRSKVTQEGEPSWSHCDTNHLNNGASAVRVQRKRQLFQTLGRLNGWKELMMVTVVVILISSSLPHWLFSLSAKGFLKWKHIVFSTGHYVVLEKKLDPRILIFTI